MATVPAPRRSPAHARAVAPAPARRKEQPRPSSLRVVGERNRQPRYALWTVVGVGAVFALFFALVLFHTLLLQNQRRLDQLDSQVRTEQARYQQLRLQVAQLQSPERILQVATAKLGLVPSNGTRYLTPSGADAVAARQAQAQQAADDGTTSLTADNQGASSGWPQIKPYLGGGG
jgi:cell division protein FtsL